MRSFIGWKSRLWLFQLSILPSILIAQQHFVPPPNLNLENLPNTTFSCEGKVVGGYYADVDTGCQMFHVCTLGQKGETQDIKFLCLQGTVFAQETRVCERTEEVNCQGSGNFYDINKELYHNSNKIHLEFDGNVTDSASEASITHVFLPYEADYSDADRFQEDYQDDFSQQYRGRSTDYRGRTRSEVPLFNSRRTEQRSTHSLPPPQVQPFSRFRQTRRFGGRISTPFPSAVSTSPAISLPSTEAPAASPVVSSTIAVPLIPVKNPDGPHVVVTNGKPFVPKLDASDPAPTLQQESEYHSLALPDTNFTCADKVSGGHYADPETDCRMFHICVMGPNETITDYKLLCGNNTVFEQKSRTCQEIEKVDCASSVLNYYVNNHLIVPKWLENVADNQHSQAANLNAQIKALNNAQLIVTERMAASTAAIGSQSAAVGDSDAQSALSQDNDGQSTPANITSSSNGTQPTSL